VLKLGWVNTFIARNIEHRNSMAANGNKTINTSPPPPRDGGIETETIKPVFHFSRNEKNVFIVMLDGAVSSYFQIFLEKNPQYLKDYEGFTYYPNTASFFRNTIFGAVSLFGGYEYATYRMNERKDKLMKDKNNEAMLLLPELFKQNGFEVTVTNMPYINYETIEDPRFFTERGIHAEPVSGRYDHKFLKENLGLDEYPKPPPTDRLLRRNLLLFAAMETSVLGARDFIYQNGNYWSSVDYSLDSGLPSKTISNYTALYYLPQFINMDGTGGTLTIMVNDLTHDPVYLQFPDFTLRETVTETGENFFHNERSYKDYHVNAASYTLLARTFRYLKENGVWDNTRVIIVSDHGDFGIVHPEFSTFQNFHTLQYNPILLVKDFNAEGKLKTNNDFMTNADVPALALAGIVDNPVNPFTGNPVAADKEDGVYIYLEGNTNPNYYNGTTMLTDDSKFFHVRASIFDSENWREVRYRDFKTR
jgi:hypothetical protein